MTSFNITDKEFQTISKLVYHKAGVKLTPIKKQLVISRLSKRLNKLKLTSFTNYLNYLKNNQEELTIMLNLITTNMTYFFREEYHFEFLTEYLLPELCLKNRKNRNINAWSAASSTGEEIYSIAITLKEFFQSNKQCQVNLLASDINTDVIRIAQEGIYKEEQIKKIRKNLLPKYFKLGVGENKGKFKVKDDIKRMVKWQQINLVGDTYPIKEPLDFIFCRNVFIYFDKETQRKTLKKIHSHLKKGAYLFLGHSENIDLSKQDAGSWELLTHSIYRAK